MNNCKKISCKLIAILSLALLLFSVHTSSAQLPISTNNTKATQTSVQKDILGRETPRGLVKGFFNAVKEENYAKAALFIDLDKYPISKRKRIGKRLSKSLQTLLDQGGSILPTSKLSSDPNGNEDDNSNINIDVIGNIKINKKEIDVLAEKYKDPEYGQIWRISKRTVLSIPLHIENNEIGYLDKILPESMIDNKISGVPIGHWIALFLITIISLMVSWFLTIGVVSVIHFIWKKTRKGYGKHLFEVFIWPIRIYISVCIFALLANTTGISIVARQHFSTVGAVIALLSLAWIIWSIIDLITEAAKERLLREKKRSALSAIVFFRRAARAVFVLAVIAITLKNMGWDLTAGLTALGIGGLAIALGAQKTLENFMSSLHIIIEQPMRVGDFCKVGDIKGTVLEIGMRSTRIQTLNKTIATIPNSQLAIETIENYELRDHFLFTHDVGLRYETSPDQIRYILVKIRELMYTHPCIEPDGPTRVRLNRFDSSSINLNVFAYIYADNYKDFLEIQEDIMLRIIDIIDEGGSSFAFPSTTLYLGKDTPLSQAKKDAAEKKVRKWRKEDESKLYHFSEKEVEKIADSLKYNPKANKAIKKKKL